MFTAPAEMAARLASPLSDAGAAQSLGGLAFCSALASL